MEMKQIKLFMEQIVVKHHQTRQGPTNFGVLDFVPSNVELKNGISWYSWS